MAETLFKPGPDRTSRIAPKERDEWRGRVAHGELHDENAFALGSVAPRAGLFGTAPDLARVAQMPLNGGVFEHPRIVSRPTLELFPRRAGVPDSSRALGWDTPSPNLRSAEAALAYPGVCLLEATNVSEGRGTPSPFLLLGGLWLKASELAATVVAAGFELEPTHFTPRGSAAAPHPRLDGKTCQGLRVPVTDPREASRYGLVDPMRVLRYE
jgi:hypothetical protein